jgi:hypothetical protein
VPQIRKLKQMVIISHLAVIVVYSFLQFYYVLNKPAPLAAMFMLLFIVGAFYFLGWWAILSLLIGGTLGGYQAMAWMRKKP